MKTNENAFSAFSDETLNEMAMEDLEGGIDKEDALNKKCPVNNCQASNCIAGCGAVPKDIN